MTEFIPTHVLRLPILRRFPGNVLKWCCRIMGWDAKSIERQMKCFFAWAKARCVYLASKFEQHLSHVRNRASKTEVTLRRYMIINYKFNIMLTCSQDSAYC